MESFKGSKIVLVDKKKANKALPIIATFQNANLNQEIAYQTVCKRVQTEEDGRKYALIATESNIYKSDITNPDNEFQDTYIAIHNKKTKEVKLIQVENASFKHVVYDNSRSSFEQNILDTKKILAKEFAGKKGAISYERSLRTKVNSSILEDTVDKMLTTLDTEKFDENELLEESQKDSEKFRDYIFPKVPDNSTDGKGFRDIFTINNVIGNDILEHLSEIAIDILNIDPKSLPFTNKYLKNGVVLIQNSKQPDSAENLKKMAMLIYAESLISLINQGKSRYIRSNNDLLKFSDQLRNDLSKKFYNPGSKQASNITKQKAIVFYGILTLLISQSLEVSLTDILDSVDLSKKDLLKYMSVIGCKAKGDILHIVKVAKVDKDGKFETPVLKSKSEKRK